MEKGDTFRVHVRYVSHKNIYGELACGARANVASHRLMDVDDRESVEGNGSNHSREKGKNNKGIIHGPSYDR